MPAASGEDRVRIGCLDQLADRGSLVRRVQVVGLGDAIADPIAELAGIVRGAADRAARLQQGRIATYLLYSFVTLVVLLALVL